MHLLGLVNTLPNNPFANLQVPADHGPYEVAHFVLLDRNPPKQSAYKQFRLDEEPPTLDVDVFVYRAQLIQFLFPVDSIVRSNNEVFLPGDQ